MPTLVSAAVSSTSPAIHASLLRVWLLRTSAWRPRWQELQGWVDPAQRRRLAGMRDPSRLRDRLLAHALHRCVLARALSLSPDRLPLYRSTSGQPRVALPGLHTSLSHSDDVVAIALSQGSAVGVDVEMRRTPSLRPIADLVCTPVELARLQGHEDDETRLLDLWVRKEAALKATGLGLSRSMASFEAADGAHLCLRDTGGAPVAMQVRSIEAGPDCAVAVAGPPGHPPQWQWLQPDN